MTTGYDVRHALRAIAEDAEIAALSGPEIRRRAAGRARAGRAIGVLATAAAVVVGALVVPGIRLDRRPEPVAAAAYLGWPARGNLAADAAYVGAAVEAWRPPPGNALPAYREVQTLYATKTTAGPVVILAGREPNGERRVAAFRGSGHEAVFSGRLAKFYDAVPARDDVLVVPLPEVVGLPGLVVVVASPAATSIEWADTAAPSFAGGASGAGWSLVGTWRGTRVRVREGDREIVAGVPPSDPAETQPLLPYDAGPSWRSVDGAALPGGGGYGRDITRRLAYTLHGSADPAAAADELWSAVLPDGVEVFVEVVRPGAEHRLVVGTRNANVVDIYVDRPLPPLAERQAFAVVVEGETRDWVIVVGPAGRTQQAELAADGTTYEPLEMHANAGLLKVARRSLTGAARARVTTDEGTRQVPILAFGLA